jgi:hypothetical protein
MGRHTPNGIVEYGNVTMNTRARKIDIVLAAVDLPKSPTETRLRGWGERTRPQKCRFARRWPELLGFPEFFCTRDFSWRPTQIAPVKATFASSSPFTQSQSRSHGANSVRIARGRSRSDQD